VRHVAPRLQPVVHEPRLPFLPRRLHAAAAVVVAPKDSELTPWGYWPVDVPRSVQP
jgi:hypothetical protein